MPQLMGLGIGSVPWNPSFLGAKLQLWLRGDYVVEAGGNISQWTDLSGNARHATQAGATKPTVSTLNGKPAVAFAAASSQLLDLPNDFGALTEATLVIAAQRALDPPGAVATSGGFDFGNSGGNAGTHFPFTDGVVYDNFASSTRQTVTRAASNWNVPFMYEAISTAAEWTARINNVQRFTTAVNAVAWSATPNLGELGGGGGAFFDGVMGEVLIVSPVLTAGERTSLVAYLKARWGLPNVP